MTLGLYPCRDAFSEKTSAVNLYRNRPSSGFRISSSPSRTEQRPCNIPYRLPPIFARLRSVALTFRRLLCLLALSAASRAQALRDLPAFSAEPKALLQAANAMPKTADTEAAWIFQDLQYKFETDGRYVVSEHRAVQVANAQGAGAFSSIRLEWSPWQELLMARWADVDLFARSLSIQRSKTEAGHRLIPLNDEGMAGFARLRKRADVLGGGAAEHFVFPACENGKLDFTRNQKTFRTAWRSLVKAAAKRAGDEAAKVATESGADPDAARKRAAKPFHGFRFHDLRHQSTTEMAEAGVPEAAMQSIAGHLSKKMLDHYSHVRMAAKRSAVEALGGGLIAPEPDARQGKGEVN